MLLREQCRTNNHRQHCESVYDEHHRILPVVLAIKKLKIGLFQGNKGIHSVYGYNQVDWIKHVGGIIMRLKLDPPRPPPLSFASAVPLMRADMIRTTSLRFQDSDNTSRRIWTRGSSGSRLVQLASLVELLTLWNS